MAHPQAQPLRPLTPDEQHHLERLSRARSAPAEQVSRAAMLLAVSQGHPFTLAAQHVGRTSGNAVARLIRRFNLEGLEALTPRHGGGHVVEYTPEVRSTIIAEALRTPDPELDGTATWSLTTLQRSLRNKGLPRISTYTVWTVLHEAGLTWQRSRTWCETGVAHRQRQAGIVQVTDPDAEAKKR